LFLYFQVCVAWRNAAYNRRVWHGIEARLHLSQSSMSPFSSLIRRGIKRVHVLSMRKSARDMFAEAVPMLESLSVRGCQGLTDAALAPAFNGVLPALTSLDVGLCRQLTDSTLGRVVSSAQNLESLDVSGCGDITDNGVLLVACGLKRLKILNLRGCRLISDAGIAHLAGAGSIAASAAGAVSTLEKLVLHDCQRITDTGLGHIGAGLRALRVLDISFCAGITDDGLQCIARLPVLQEFRARACDGITDAGVSHFWSSPRLNILDIAFCIHVTDRALAHLARSTASALHLRELWLSSCTITDDGLDHLTAAAVELRSLHIGQCRGVTDRGLTAIAQNLKWLESVDIYGCTQVTSAGLNVLQQLPNLKTVNVSLLNRT
jgi:F-box and leucine-rich repeat protein 14